MPAFYVFLLLLLNTFLYAECELSQTDREAGREGQPVRPYPFDAVDISPEKTLSPNGKWLCHDPDVLSTGVLNLKCV